MSVSLRLVAEMSASDAATFHALRPRLFRIAYRVLGSTAEADDVVQEAWIRWQGTDRGAVRDATGFLVAATTRLAINVGQSARVRHETSIETRPPDVVDIAADPWLDAEQGEALESAVHLLSQKLPAAERAAYVLREAFDYPYRQIGQVLALSEANARQLVTRARRRLSGEHRRPVRRAEQLRLVDAFVAAAQMGDITTLEDLLVADVAGSGEVVGTTRHAIRGQALRVAA
jgi:RNA polymerase sigma-70 factor (ECF subfamily)